MHLLRRLVHPKLSGSSPESVGKKGRQKLRSGSANGGRPLSHQQCWNELV